MSSYDIQGNLISEKKVIENFAEVSDGKCQKPCGSEKLYQGKHWCYTEPYKGENTNWKYCQADQQIIDKCPDFNKDDYNPNNKKNLSDNCLNALNF